ncbi:MAG: Smr/MutS family protein [Desulfobacterales bacterium]|jgi:DNA-nicking Smr family endonuclease
MNDDRRSGSHRPFKHLNRILDRDSLPLSTGPKAPAPVEIDDEENAACDAALFNAAMSGVAPIAQDKFSPIEDVSAETGRRQPHQLRCDVLCRLAKLVQTGDGFSVADTPEYQEGVGPRVHPRVSRHLHGGRYAIEAHIDLHGLNAPEAERAVDDFLREAVRSGKRTVLVVHGRGLSSPQQPVLKTKVRDWLIRGAWRKWVMAFASARLCDGGAGATYVLLRQKPLTRQFRKSHRRRDSLP